MRTVLFVLIFMAGIIPINAQAISELARNINNIKRDTMYIYAEATMSDLSEAYNGARAILEMKVGDWVRKLHPNEAVEVCIVKAKEHFAQLETKRGDFYRAFVYVRKSDILPVADKSEVAVFDVTPIPEQSQQTVAPAIIVEKENVPAESTPTIELTSEEQQMKKVRSFYEIEPYIKVLKNQGKLNDYGKYATMQDNYYCHMFVYDKQGNILALLRKCGPVQYNLSTLKEDNVKNYKNCGAIWFRLKD